MMFEKDEALSAACRECYMSLGGMRRKRRRLKRFTYGRQWDDEVRDYRGRVMSEEELMARQGHHVVTNNLMRQLVKGVIGRRRMLAGDSGKHYREVSLEDRCLEEFLISGMCAVRIDDIGRGVVNISPSRLFYRSFLSSDGADCNFIGMLHDMSFSEMARRFGNKDSGYLSALWRNFENSPRSMGRPGSPGEAVDFDRPTLEDTCRVIEVWRRKAMPVISCCDPESGDMARGASSADADIVMRQVNEARVSRGLAALHTNVEISEGWEQTWLLPGGEILGREMHSEQWQPPIVVVFYPMIDGEVHSLMEDVVGQQKMINRLVTLLDEVVAGAAKGVVLYPSDQLPDGMTWEDLRRLWTTPGSIVPFRRTSKQIMPREVLSGGALVGAADLLDRQISMFREISGMPSVAGEGVEARMSAEAIEAHTQRSTCGILDVMGAFDDFMWRIWQVAAAYGIVREGGGDE